MFNPLKMGEMLSKANEAQEEIKRRLGETVVEGESGGGAVRVTMNGKKELMKLRLDPAAVVGLAGEKPDVEMLEDLIVAAVNEGIRKAQEMASMEMAKLTGGLNVPGLF